MAARIPIKQSDFPSGTRFIIKDWDVPLIHNEKGWFNWYGGNCSRYDYEHSLRCDNNWPADWKEWADAMERSGGLVDKTEPLPTPVVVPPHNPVADLPKDESPLHEDFPANTQFIIKDGKVPLINIPEQGWFNWFGGSPVPFDPIVLTIDNSWPASSFDEWVKVVEASKVKHVQQGDVPAGARLMLVPIVHIPGQGWFNWSNGTPSPCDADGLELNREMPRAKFEEWAKVVDKSQNVVSSVTVAAAPSVNVTPSSAPTPQAAVAAVPLQKPAVAAVPLQQPADVARAPVVAVSPVVRSGGGPHQGDFLTGTEFIIKDWDVPLVKIPGKGWFCWWGGKSFAYDPCTLKADNNWPASSFELWAKVVAESCS